MTIQSNEILKEELYCYRDCSYKETIDNIKIILFNLDIDVSERVEQGVEGVYSVRLDIKGLLFGTNGKGFSEEAAKASAYAELMERLQSFALYKYKFPVWEFNSKIHKFIYHPDEYKLSRDEFSKKLHFFKDSVDISDIDKLILLHSAYELEKNIILATNYHDVLNNKVIGLPSKIIDYLYGSNGLSAGNTNIEALVQGICEVFERYANKVICEGNITPPTIPIDEIGLSSEILAIILAIKENKDYDIIFKDCSLGIGIPVVGMIFIDKGRGKYFVKFGAHPKKSIAAERTISELFQGRKLHLANLWLKTFEINPKIDKLRNFERIFRDGDGVYEKSIFANESTYEYKDIWYSSSLNSNTKFIEYLMKIIKINKWNLYYKNISYLGFPSVHIIIPEISNINTIDDNYVKHMNTYNDIKRKMKNLGDCTVENLIDIIKFIDSNYYTKYDNISSLIGLPLSDKNKFSNMNINYFKFIIKFSLREYDEAIVHLSDYMDVKGIINSKSGVFYRCLKEYIVGVFIELIDSDSCIDILSKVYKKETLDSVVEYSKNISIVKLFDKYNCSDCSICDKNDECLYREILKFDQKIKENIIDLDKGENIYVSYS